MKSRYSALVLSLTLMVLTTIVALSADKKPIGIDFFTQVKSISNLKVLNGNVLFVVKQPNKETNSYSSDLYQFVDNKPLRLTKNISDYFFQDGGIIFRDVRDEQDREKIKKGEPLTVFQKLSFGFQEAEEWLRIPYKINEVEWIDKQHFFYTTTYDHKFELLLKENKGNRQLTLKKKEENSKNFRVFDELPFWSNGRGDVSGLRTHLHYYNNGSDKLLTDTFETVSSLEISPDKKTIIYANKLAYYGKVKEGNQLITLNTETLEKKVWSLFNQASYGSYQFINNDEIILTINRSIEHDRIENSGIYKLDIRTGKLTEIYNGSIYGVGNSVGSDIGGGGRSKFTFDKEGIQYITTNVDQAPLIHIAYKDAKVNLITKGNIVIQEYVPYKDGFLAVALVDQLGSEIYFIDKKGNYTALTSINKNEFEQYNIVKPIEITFTNDEGRKLNGYVLPPANYEKGKKYPTIFNIHGGPKGTYGTVFFHEMQYWANQGYAVIFTNPRGSDGRGSKFADIRGKVGDVDYKDLIAFVDTALSKTEFLDKDRLGVVGGSYGGLMTNWIIGQTTRFKAAASLRGISSWLTHSTTSDIGHTYTYNYWGTDLWKNQEVLWKYSPLKYADKVTTPTLFLHSDEDYRCWQTESIQMYYALQYLKIPTRFVLFKGENHDLSRSGKPLNRIKRLEEITGWFDKYLKY